MKRGLIVIFLLISVILISDIPAYQSTITVKTGLPNKDIIFRACDQATGKTLDGGEFKQKADSEGKVVFEYDLEPALIKMSFMAWNGNGYSTFLNGKETIFMPNVILNKFVDVDLNKKEPSFNAYSDEPEESAVVAQNEPEDTTENSTSSTDVNVNVEVNEEKNSSETIMDVNKEKIGITGAAIGRVKSIATSKITYYIIGGIFILGVLVFVVFVLNKKLNGKGTYISFRIKEGKTEDSIGKQIHDKRLIAAEIKLEEAKKELDEIKNRKSKLDEVRMRFEQDKKELERLEQE